MLLTLGCLVVLAAPADPSGAKKNDDAGFVIASGTFAVGFQVGSPTGVTGKLKLDTESAVDALVGVGAEGFEIQGDYLREVGRLARDEKGDTSIYGYFGLGGRFSSGENDDVDLGVRVPFGVELRFASVRPLEVYLELAPGLVLSRVVEGSLDGALGVRWYL